MRAGSSRRSADPAIRELGAADDTTGASASAYYECPSDPPGRPGGAIPIPTALTHLMNFFFSIKSSSAVAALLLGCLAIGAETPSAEPIPKPLDSVTAADLILKGDAFDRTFKATEALQSYLAAERLEPRNVPLLVRIARQFRHLMTDATAREKKLQLGGMALDYSLRAATLGPKDSEAQLAPAITYGKMLLIQGTKEQVAASGPIKRSADAAIRLDPRNDTAWHILGRWHRNVAAVTGAKRVFGSLIYGNLPKSTNEAAVACFEKAIALNPRRLMHYIELGRTYAEMGKKDDARRLIAKGLAMPDTEKDDPETKQRGREALAKLR
jgi:tetratricopeptide (TPR) repeat protein